MKSVIVLFCITIVIFSSPWISDGATRSENHNYRGHLNSRQGGENWNDAYVIDGLPFFDSGTTDGYEYNADGNGMWCPIPPTGPDVYYEYSPTTSMYINVDLCGSQFDTIVIVRDQELHEVDCFDYDQNHHYYGPESPCGESTARLSHVPLEAGQIYYIVVSGLSASGIYEIYVHEENITEIEMPPAAIAEGEPPIEYQYIDYFNSGCSNIDPAEPIQDIDLIGNSEMIIYGNSGWPLNWRSDTDWYAVELGPEGYLHVELCAEYGSYLMHLDPPDCDTYEISQWGLSQHGESCSFEIIGQPGTTAWIFVAPRSMRSDIWPDYTNFHYLLTFNTNPVLFETKSWSTLKSMYR